MIVTSRAEIKMLRGGSAREIKVKKPRPRPGATKARCRWTVGRDYSVTCRPVRNDEGEIIERAETIRCLVFGITEDETHWTLGLRFGAAESQVFLAANPGAQRTDYVLVSKAAMAGEPEVLDESADRVRARKVEKDKAQKVKRADAIANLEEAIRRLEDGATVSERGQIQRLKAQHRKLADAA